MSSSEELDKRMREAAFQHVRLLSATRDHLTSNDLAEGFVFDGKRIPLVNPQRGIFKPREMRYLLSHPDCVSAARSRTAYKPLPRGPQSSCTRRPHPKRHRLARGNAKQLRTNRRTHERFWGCTSYPGCRGTRQLAENAL